MDRCDVLKETMIEVLYDEAEAPARARLEEHLSSCADCRQELEDLRRVRARLATAEVPAEPMTPRVLVLGKPRAPRRRALRWLAAAAAIAALGLLTLGSARVDVSGGGLILSVGNSGALSARQESAIRAEIRTALEAYERRDEQERQALVASFREELRRRDAARQNDANALADVLMGSWSQAREDDLRFVLDQLGTLEQRTGQQMQRTQELLQYAVFTGRDQ